MNHNLIIDSFNLQQKEYSRRNAYLVIDQLQIVVPVIPKFLTGTGSTREILCDCHFRGFLFSIDLFVCQKSSTFSYIVMLERQTGSCFRCVLIMPKIWL